MSWLPLQDEPQHQDDSSGIVYAEEEQLQSLPMCATDIKTAIAKDPVLSQVHNFTVRG